jgi:predicted Zn-dependent protease
MLSPCSAGFIGVNTGTILTAQSESELAGVLAHEIGHVTQNHLARQIAKSKQNTIPSMIAMAVGILAARSNSDIAAATITSAQASVVQAQLAYTRDYEREADRLGYQTIEKAGLDVRGMGDFFERLQKAGRLYENNAPVYLRSHPLTLERISDMQNRAQLAPYRQVISDLDFHLVRAKLRAQMGTAREAISDFELQLREKKYASLAATHYGLAVAHMRQKDAVAAQREIEAIKALKVSSPMISGLAAQIRVAANDIPGAQAIYREALQNFPQSKALIYGYAESLLAGRQYDQCLQFLDSQMQISFSDFKLYGLQAKPSRHWASACSSIERRQSSTTFRDNWCRRSSSCSMHKGKPTGISTSSPLLMPVCANSAHCRRRKRNSRERAGRMRLYLSSGLAHAV